MGKEIISRAETAFIMDTSRIKFGIGVTSEIGEDIKALNCDRVMVLTDPNLSGSEPVSRVLDTFMRDLSSCTGIIGHNIEFDKKMLEVECIRNKCRRLSSYRKMTFCTMKMGKHRCNILKENPFTGKMEAKWPKLIELHKHLFNTEPKNLHNSLIDVIVCFRCFHALTYNVDPVDTNDQMKHYCKIYCGL